MEHLTSPVAYRLSIINEQQDDQGNLSQLVDNADRLQVKAVDDEVQNERHSCKENQQPTDKTLKTVQYWQVECDDEHKVSYTVKNEER